jgi:LysR family transcriptional regulator for bpeEF and oprC
MNADLGENRGCSDQKPISGPESRSGLKKMSIDRYKSMEVFVRVVEFGSFTQAATALHMPKGRVTTIIQELEVHLGVRLLNRTTRRLSLTDDGSVYHQRAMAMLQEMDELETALGQSVATAAGRLRIDIPASFGRNMLAPALPGFFERYPNIVLEVGSSDRPVDLIAEGVDCVIRGRVVDDDTLIARHLAQIRFMTCAAPSYLEKYGVPKSIEDLDNHHFVNHFSAKTGRMFPFEFEQDDQTHKILKPHWVASNDSETCLAAGVAGMGLLQIPCTRMNLQTVAAGKLVTVLDDWNQGTLPIMVMYPRNRHLTAKVRAFVEWAIENFRIEFPDSVGRDVQSTRAASLG